MCAHRKGGREGELGLARVRDFTLSVVSRMCISIVLYKRFHTIHTIRIN